MVAVVTFMGHFFLFMMTWMIIDQYKLILKGQTPFEYSKGISTYQKSMRDNLRDLLGNYWYLTWLCPMIPSILPGDGILFQLTATAKHK